MKRVLRRCVISKKLEGLSYPAHTSLASHAVVFIGLVLPPSPLKTTAWEATTLPDLPRIPVSDDPPFTHVGIDFAGPLYYRASSDSESNNERCYVCLFTCATTRAVHLELARNLTVDIFLLAF